MHTEAIRAVADWIGETYFIEDGEIEQFALTCKTAYETLQEELDWLQEIHAEDRETVAMEEEDVDADTGRKWWSPEKEAGEDAREFVRWLRDMRLQDSPRAAP